MDNITINIITGVISSGIFGFIVYVTNDKIIPVIIGRFQQVPKINGTWNLFDDDTTKQVGTCAIVQYGNKIKMTMIRTLTRAAKPMNRTFLFKGKLNSNQLVMIFEENEGKGFITGVSVFQLSPNLRELKGLVIFNDHEKNKIISLKRVLIKL